MRFKIIFLLRTNCSIPECFVAKTIYNKFNKNDFLKKISLNVGENRSFEKIVWSITKMIRICPAAFRRISMIMFLDNFSGFSKTTENSVQTTNCFYAVGCIISTILTTLLSIYNRCPRVVLALHLVLVCNIRVAA